MMLVVLSALTLVHLDGALVRSAREQRCGRCAETPVATFMSSAELMRSMAAGKQAHRCYAKKLASFGLQRDIVDKDVPLLDTLSKTSMENGSIKNIILALVQSDAFRVREAGNP